MVVKIKDIGIVAIFIVVYVTVIYAAHTTDYLKGESQYHTTTTKSLSINETSHSIFEGLTLQRQNHTKKGAHPKSLYRKNPCLVNEAIIDWLPYHEEMATLLTPPEKITLWDLKTPLETFHRRLVLKLLEPWKDGISSSFHHRVGPDEHVFVQYINKSLYIRDHQITNPTGFRFKRRFHALHAIYEVLKDQNFPVGDFEATISVSDSPFESTNDKHVAFGLVSGHPIGCMLPLSEMEWDFPSYSGWNSTHNEISHWRDKYPWKDRLNTAVFRGGERVCFPEDGDEAAIPSKNVQALLEKDLIKCGREALMNVTRSCDTHLFNVDFDTNRLPLQDQEKHKLIIYAEGHIGWANRLRLLLGMRNAIIKQENKGGMEWYTFGLEPWVHYIPVDHLFLSLPEVVKWALAHDELILQISANADRYFETVLTSNSMKLRLGILLEEFSKLFKYKIQVREGAFEFTQYLNRKSAIHGDLVKWGS